MQKINLKKIRKEYIKNVLSESSVAADPFVQFTSWFDEALCSGAEEPTAMFLATASKKGFPSGRMVLLKEFSVKGFVFFSNYNSPKGLEISENPAVALTFHWKELERQVRITGKAKRIPEKESDEYFRTRPFESRVSAVISPQSSVIRSREFLEKERDRFMKNLRSKEIDRPAHWGGFIVKPVSIEFWQGRESRLHDRILYSRKQRKWIIERLAP